MKEVGDVIGWIVGALGTLVFILFRSNTTRMDDRLKMLFVKQNEVEVKMGKIEVQVEGIQLHYLKTLEEIKAQNTEMAKDITLIKVALARLPKRRED